MWQRFSLVTRLSLIQSAILVAVFAVALPVVVVVSGLRLAEEREPLELVAGQIARSLNTSLAIASDPDRVIGAFSKEFTVASTGFIRFVPVAGSADAERQHSANQPPIPSWFRSLMAWASRETPFPIIHEGRPVGHLIVTTNNSAELFEKWLVFASTIVLGLLLVSLTFIMARLVLGSIVVPLQEIGFGLEQLQSANYDVKIRSVGPPEIRKSFDQLNELAKKLKDLTDDNRALIQRFIGLQEQERHQISQELHDELGPLLFALRANSSVLAANLDDRQQEAKERVATILNVIESLQLANRRILDRMRPMSVQEVGLVRSLESLFRSAAFETSSLDSRIDLDPAIDDVPQTIASTVYRLAQEGLTNILRHAGARRAELSVKYKDAPSGHVIEIVILDDGNGALPGFKYGRGLTGMKERVDVLRGELRFDTGKLGTKVTATIPISPSGS